MASAQRKRAFAFQRHEIAGELNGTIQTKRSFGNKYRTSLGRKVGYYGIDEVGTIGRAVGRKPELGYIYYLLTVTFITKRIVIVITARCAQYKEQSAY